MDEKKEYLVQATVTLRGAWMVVDAASADEAKEIARREPDYELQSAELIDWEVTDVQLNE